MRHQEELDANGFSCGHLTSKLSIHYLVKCRSCSLAIHNNEFILDSPRVGSEI